MEFHVLGPVELLHGDRKVPITRAKTRHALGVLLLAQGRPVSAETMMEALWDDRPDHVRKDLQSYLSRLRRTLRLAHCTARVRSHEGSYLLEAPDDEIDYDRSTALLDRGRQARQRGHLDEAADLLRDAIELWHGLPVQGLNTLWMELRREDLDFQLASCWQARIEVDLLRHNYSEALNMVNKVIPDHEFDKAFIGQKLAALNGCGRYSEFDSYWQRIRLSGIKAFGTEPDSELQDLHIRLLQERDGYHLSHSPVTAGGNPLPTPAQLPPQSADFVGRDELDALDEALGRTRANRPTAMPVLAVVGGVATGKTTLAVEWAHDNRRRFPDGQLFADLRGFDRHPPARAFDVLADFLVALGLAQDQLPDTTERRTSLFRSVVDGRQVLIVLDNARDTDQVRPLLPGSSSCVVVVTSRHRLPDLVSRHAARRVTLGALPRPAAAGLLRESMEVDRLARESTALSTVVDLCGGGCRVCCASWRTRWSTDLT
ncbi:BTAD domain-containing putative transcriptional regulator [Umezawaea endophytica]|uniref:Winged helix-turn-helix domain-containing protein n=1 Tax=Umezawaea endophytica TaxID=1654476 RepID=A0A9X2VMQ9_9PSEU|nr:BTAD domain-containing putative transcriptional regulator [Umezawaea endophytica]MCS7479440.1 winged helix-turn-helix domain-containing protein [Umezawaea endophytica]